MFFKKKESGWYNGIALAMDAMTAGLGGNVYLRDVNKAKEAQQKQDQLRMEQKAEDAQNAQAMQQAGLSYGKWADAITRNYLSKVQSTVGGESTKTTTHGAKTGYTTRAFSPSQMNPGKDWSKDKPRLVVKVNQNDPNNPEKYKTFELDSEKEYETIRDVLSTYYSKKVYDEMKNQRNPDTGELPKGGYFETFRSMGVVNDKGEVVNPDLLMHGGEYFTMDDAVKGLIEKATGGKVKFTGPVSKGGWNGVSALGGAVDAGEESEFDDIFG